MNTTLPIIADFPAFQIVSEPTRRFRDGDKIAIMFDTKRYGRQPHMFTLGSVFGYAVKNGDDVMATYERAVRLGHKLHWANPDAVVIHNGPHTKSIVRGFEFGDAIQFEGKTFILNRAPNDNVTLVEAGSFSKEA